MQVSKETWHMHEQALFSPSLHKSYTKSSHANDSSVLDDIPRMGTAARSTQLMVESHA